MEEKKKATHFWRCMNCGEMTDQDVCQNCGKESYIKTEEAYTGTVAEKKSAFGAAKKGDTNEDSAAVKELKTAIMTSGENAADEARKVKRLVYELCGLILLLVIALLVICFNTKAQVEKLEAENNDLKTSITNGFKKQSSELEKALAQTDSQPQTEEETNEPETEQPEEKTNEQQEEQSTEGAK